MSETIAVIASPSHHAWPVANVIPTKRAATSAGKPNQTSQRCCSAACTSAIVGAAARGAGSLAGRASAVATALIRHSPEVSAQSQRLGVRSEQILSTCTRSITADRSAVAAKSAPSFLAAKRTKNPGNRDENHKLNVRIGTSRAARRPAHRVAAVGTNLEREDLDGGKACALRAAVARRGARERILGRPLRLVVQRPRRPRPQLLDDADGRGAGRGDLPGRRAGVAGL